MGGAFALNGGKAACESQPGFGRFERVDFYGAFVESTMPALGLLCVGEKGGCRAI